MSATPSYLVLAGAVVLDAWLELPSSLHPVAWFGTLASAWISRSPLAGRVLPGAMGLAIALGLPAGVFIATRCLLQHSASQPWLSLALQVFLLHASFSLFGLVRAAQRLRAALQDSGLDAARQRLSWLCSRDARELDATALCTGTLESIAENLSDSVVAPLFFWLCAGLPGAAAYRALNTLDAMIGYHGRYEWLGKASARFDDLANLIPARLTALCLVAAGSSMPRRCGVSVARGFRVWREDRSRTESPNAGQPMAMAAGLLGLRLDKPGHYVLGAAQRAPVPEDIDTGVVLVRRAGLLALGAAVWLAWARGGVPSG